MTVTSTPDGICVRSTFDGICVRVNWSTMDGVSGYNVYRSHIPFGDFEQLNSSLIEGITYYDTPSTTVERYWYYKVSAEDVDGEGSLSDPYAFEIYEIFDASPVICGLSWSDLL